MGSEAAAGRRGSAPAGSMWSTWQQRAADLLRPPATCRRPGHCRGEVVGSDQVSGSLTCEREPLLAPRFAAPCHLPVRARTWRSSKSTSKPEIRCCKGSSPSTTSAAPTHSCAGTASRGHRPGCGPACRGNDLRRPGTPTHSSLPLPDRSRRELPSFGWLHATETPVNPWGKGNREASTIGSTPAVAQRSSTRCRIWGTAHRDAATPHRVWKRSAPPRPVTLSPWTGGQDEGQHERQRPATHRRRGTAFAAGALPAECVVSGRQRRMRHVFLRPCTVLVDGERSILRCLCVQVDGSQITTAEGLPPRTEGSSGAAAFRRARFALWVLYSRHDHATVGLLAQNRPDRNNRSAKVSRAICVAAPVSQHRARVLASAEALT